MKKLILIALAFAGINASAATFGIKPVVEEPKCNGTSTGSISLVLSGGTAPYTYIWNNGSIASSLSNLPAGPYSVTVTDANNQVATNSFTMTQYNAINLHATAVNSSGQGASDGCIHLAADGGTPTYTYLWSNASTLESPCGLTAGTYTVTVTDAFGCTSVLSKSVMQEQALMQSHNQQQIHTSSLSHVPAPGNSGGYELKDLQINGDNSTAEIKAEDVNVYPNPTSGFVTVNTGTTNSGELLLINTLGQTIHHQAIETNETRIDLSNVAKGNYVLVVKTENGNTNKIISVVK